MPMLYDVPMAAAATAPANIATNATPNTETIFASIKPGVRNCAIQAAYAIGKGAALTAISGIVIRLLRWGTATVIGSGTTLGIVPKDPGMQACKAVGLGNMAGALTTGTTRTNKIIMGCGAAGPGVWVAPNPDSMLLQEGGAATSIDAISASGTASLNYEFSMEMQE